MGERYPGRGQDRVRREASSSRRTLIGLTRSGRDAQAVASCVDVHRGAPQETDERHAISSARSAASDDGADTAVSTGIPLLHTHASHTVRPPITAWLGDVNAHPSDTRLIPVTRTGRKAIPVGHDRPGSLRGAALADALAVVPPGHQGGEVELL